MKNRYVPDLLTLCPALGAEDEVSRSHAAGWFVRTVLWICMITFMQMSMFQIKETYAAGLPYNDAQLVGTSALVPTDLDVLGLAGERTLTNNNLAGAILRARSGKQGNQMFDFSRGAPQVWAVYDTTSMKGKIIVESMYQHVVDSPAITGGGNKSKGDVELVTAVINPSQLESFFSTGNGVQTYFNGKSPFHAFRADTYVGEASAAGISPTTFSGDPCANGSCQFLLNNIDSGSFETLVAVVARIFGTSHANVAILSTQMKQWQTSEDCGFLDLGSKITYHAKAAFKPEWLAMTASDNAYNRTYMTAYITSSATDGCLSEAEIKAFRAKGLNNLTAGDLAKVEACTVRSGTVFMPVGMASSLPSDTTAFWYHSKEGSCQIDFILMIAIMAVLAVVTMGIALYAFPEVAATMVSTLGTVGGAALEAIGLTIPAGMAGLYVAVAIGAAAAYATVSIIASGGIGSMQNSDGLFGGNAFGSLSDGGMAIPQIGQPGSEEWDPRPTMINCVLNAAGGVTGDVFGLQNLNGCYSQPVNPLYEFYHESRLCDPAVTSTAGSANPADCKYRYTTSQDAYIMKESAMVDGNGNSLSGFELPTAAGAKPKRHLEGDPGAIP